MNSGTLLIDGRKYKVVPEDEYKRLRAAFQLQQRIAKQDETDVVEARRRLKDPKRKTISLAALKAELGG